ncbi:hypothetical protein EJ04DRAFT_513814 [Polyplosphaeria fusca]|uniref:Secreted protein n=1 Tax=Polyplosphaeria fusca TaxID=682080 RepID=A0A9P4QWN8_9PLEO|nr:hypothetical protein EJ04DRAFT_513814 [Polyplosphaeria fusca]
MRRGSQAPGPARWLHFVAWVREALGASASSTSQNSCPRTRGKSDPLPLSWTRDHPTLLVRRQSPRPTSRACTDVVVGSAHMKRRPPTTKLVRSLHAAVQ